MIALAIAVFCLAFQDQVQDIDFRVRTRLEGRAGASTSWFNTRSEA
jgi:hypothetical protein